MASKLEEALKAWKAQYGEPKPRVRPARTICGLLVQRYGQDQYRCPECGMVWDVDEPRPPCQDTQVQQPQRDRP